MSDERGTPDAEALRARVRELEAERDELWGWVVELERGAETGVHTRGLTHEIRNDLTKILPEIQLAQMSSRPSDWRESLDRVFAYSQQIRARLDRFDSLLQATVTEAEVFDLRGPVEAAMDQVSYPLRKTGPDVERRLDPKATVRANRTLLALVLANAVLEVLRALPAMVMVIDRDPSTGRETERVVGRSRLRVESVRRYDRVEVRVEGTPLPGAAVGTETWREWTIGHGLPVARRVVARLGGVLEEGPLRRWIRIDLPATDAPQSGP